MNDILTVPDGPEVISDCRECGWSAGNGEPMCACAAREQAAAEERFQKECDRALAARRQVWACKVCGTVHGENMNVQPRLNRCTCDRMGHIELMTLKEAQKKG